MLTGPNALPRVSGFAPDLLRVCIAAGAQAAPGVGPPPGEGGRQLASFPPAQRRLGGKNRSAEPCARTLSLMMAASLMVGMQVREKAPPGCSGGALVCVVAAWWSV
jgi:hypothetical protein